MFSKFKKERINLINISAIQVELCDGLFNVMEDTFDKRKTDISNSRYSKEDINSIVEDYAKRNMIIAAATSIVPGPFGILGAIPELLLNFNNQMSMIYDLGCATGKENFINKDLLLDIPIAAFGGNTNLTSAQNFTSDLIDSPESILMSKAKTLGESIVQRTLKKSIVQFIPVAGPIMMGTWAKMTTRKVSESSLNFLSKDLTYVENFKPDEDADIQRLLQIEKIKALANLIESNNEINSDQIDLLRTIIDNSDLSDSEKQYYMDESLRAGAMFELDRKLLKKYEEDDDLIMQMVIMAKRGDGIDQFEKKYICEVAEYLDIDMRVVNDLL